jgi:uncharacterized protein YjbI with pentapeptide repeats
MEGAMSNLSQVWKRLRMYVRGAEPQETPGVAYEAGLPFLPLRKNIKQLNQKPEVSSDNLHKNLFIEKLHQNLLQWVASDNNFGFKVGEKQLLEELYDVLGESTLSVETTEKVIEGLFANKESRPVALFVRLENFYSRWCDGEFIDAVPDNNFPQKKMLSLQAQERTSQNAPKITLGLRQVDIYTGLNVMILLLELHRYAQKQKEIKEQIIFYPSGQPDTESFFTSKLLRIINYSDVIEIGNFSSIVGEFLKGGNFSGAYLGDANLTGVNFSGAELVGTYLGDANLTGANFNSANLSRASLGDANLSGANFNRANLSDTDLSSTNMKGANLSHANLNRADLSYADLGNAIVNYANLNRANFTSANLSNANLNQADLSSAILLGANLSDAQLSSTDLSHTDLCRADLSGADLSYAIIKGSNLSDSILFNTNLNNAVLIATDLSYAKLNGAKLNGAQLNDAILLGADLSTVTLRHSKLNDADLSSVNLNDADLSEADLTDAILFGSDLSFANLSNANLSGSNISGVILLGANLSNSNLCNTILGGADFSEANLQGIKWNENPQWEDVRGLEKAVNVPQELKQFLALLEQNL